ncbi:MAG: hypothetical protein WC992_04795 [Acholeplasmataceae bacterium]
MTDWRTTKAEWLRDMRASHMSRSITYARGDDEASIDATPIRPQAMVDSGGETVSIEARSRDWLIEAVALVLDGSETLPAAGDTITDDDGTWSVVAEPGLPEWEWLDTTHITLRVRTKLTA